MCDQEKYTVREEEQGRLVVPLFLDRQTDQHITPPTSGWGSSGIMVHLEDNACCCCREFLLDVMDGFTEKDDATGDATSTVNKDSTTFIVALDAFCENFAPDAATWRV